MSVTSLIGTSASITLFTATVLPFFDSVITPTFKTLATVLGGQ